MAYENEQLGDRISLYMSQLQGRLHEVTTSLSCPHGTNTLQELNKQDLEPANSHNKGTGSVLFFFFSSVVCFETYEGKTDKTSISMGK